MGRLVLSVCYGLCVAVVYVQFGAAYFVVITRLRKGFIPLSKYCFLWDLLGHLLMSYKIPLIHYEQLKKVECAPYSHSSA